MKKNTFFIHFLRIIAIKMNIILFGHFICNKDNFFRHFLSVHIEKSSLQNFNFPKSIIGGDVKIKGGVLQKMKNVGCRGGGDYEALERTGIY